MGTLRLLLAIAVVLGHTDYQGPHMIKGHDAVHVFFVISGFYMAMILRGKYGSSAQGLRDFALNRFLRLYPCYLGVLIASIGWAAFCHWNTGGTAPVHKIVQVGNLLPTAECLLLWLPNVTLVGIDLPPWLELGPGRELSMASNGSLPAGSFWLGETLWLNQAWSIGTEMWFYMLAPLAMSGAAFQRTLVLGLMSLGLLTSIGNRFLYGGYFLWPLWFWVFCAGLLAFLFYERFQEQFARTFHRRLSANILGILIAGTLVLSPTVGIHFPKWVLILLAAIAVCVLFEITKNNRIDRAVGDLSYPVYCVHMLIAQMVQFLIAKAHWSWNLMPWLNVGFSLIAAYLIVVLLEKRVEVFRVQISERKRIIKATS